MPKSSPNGRWPDHGSIGKLRAALCTILALMILSGDALARPRHHKAVSATHARVVRAERLAADAKPVDVERLSNRRDVRALIKGSSDPRDKNLQRWLTVSDEASGASFDEIDQFLRSNPGWPRQGTIQALAEKRMPPALAPPAVVAWFAGKEPVTGIGMVRLGEAEMAAGDQQGGAARIQRAWLTKSFDRVTEQEVLADHGKLLTQDVQDDRLARLLYGSDEGAIRRQLARVSQVAAQKATIRRALQASPKKALVQLPAALKDDPGVMFDVASALRQLGRTAEARRQLLRVARSDDVPPLRLWSEVVLNTRDALREHAYQETYDLISHHHLERGEQFADAEFLAGWIALKYLSKPDLALKHFQTLAKNVSRPISEARAEYWTGRAFEALKKKDEARAHYEIAARKPYAFYGQLALARLDAHPVLRLVPQPPESTPAQPLAKDGRVEAFRYLAAAGARDLAREFALRVADDDDLTTAKAAALIRIANESGDRALALKIAKHAEYQDVIVTEALHPTAIPGLPEASEDLSIPKAELLALVRQESEFDSGAVSTAGARGLMQLMPAVAKQRAKTLGLPYSLSRLTSDAQYNVRLGTTHFRAFFQAWGGSYVLAIASYNAGAGNVRKWIQTYGDPRNPSIDVVDWIESIPFAETRNYVQRVIENIQVYRSQLAGGSQPLESLNTLNQSGRVESARAAPVRAAPVAVVAQNVARKARHPSHRHRTVKSRRTVTAANEL